MNKLKMVLNKTKNSTGAIAAVFLFVAFTIPFLGLAGHEKIYVDDDASGRQDGSSRYPYKSIKEAIKKAEAGDEVHVRAGRYKGNIEIPEKVKVFGESRDKVIIEADDNDYEVIDMNHGTEINKITVKGGRYGVRIGKNDRASIVNCVIKSNKKDGILIEKSQVIDKYKASITDSLITKNGHNGIFSDQRRLVLINNEITENDNDGARIGGHSSVWMDENKLKNNKGSGLKITLDGANVWTDDNYFSDNKREGIEINSYGGKGTIDIKDSKIRDNKRWGIAKVQRGHFGAGVWNGVKVRDDMKIYGNEYGSVSNIIIIK